VARNRGWPAPQEARRLQRLLPHRGRERRRRWHCSEFPVVQRDHDERDRGDHEDLDRVRSLGILWDDRVRSRTP